MCPLAADDLLLVILGLVTCLSWGQAETEDDGLRQASACYGNYNSFIRLQCGPDEVIEAQKVIYGAKVVTSNCVTPATKKTYKKQCCSPEPEDCVFDASLGPVSHICNGYPACEFITQWSMTVKHCDQEEYKQYTNYMQTTYKCKRDPSIFSDSSLISPTSSSKFNTTVTTPSNATPPPGSSSRTISPTTPEPSDFLNVSLSTGPETEIEVDHTIGNPAYSRYEDDGNSMSNSMIGAIVGGSLGMLLTFVIFILYWGRKRRLRIISKPEPSVWYYLLSQTFTVRGSRGYDHFSSARSSASSEASISPVIRKNLWLPNISPEDDILSDVVSNYDNDTSRVEIHQSASPHPYAFLSLGVHQHNLAGHNHEA